MVRVGGEAVLTFGPKNNRSFNVDYGTAKVKEREGKAILVSNMDEGFCNECHNSNRSYLPNDRNGNMSSDVPCPKGVGRHLCIRGTVRKYGHPPCS